MFRPERAHSRTTVCTRSDQKTKLCIYSDQSVHSLMRECPHFQRECAHAQTKAPIFSKDSAHMLVRPGQLQLSFKRTWSKECANCAYMFTRLVRIIVRAQCMFWTCAVHSCPWTGLWLIFHMHVQHILFAISWDPFGKVLKWHNNKLTNPERQCVGDH